MSALQQLGAEQIIVLALANAAFLTGSLFYVLQTIPAVRRALTEEA